MTPPWHLVTPQARVRKVCVGPLENNAYVVVDPVSSSAALIDAAAEPERLVAAAGDVVLKAILTTHGHWDHVGAVTELTERLGIPVYIGAADAEAIQAPDVRPAEAGSLQIGELEIDMIPTPGHTPGSVTYAIAGVLFTGDTLFPGGPGATGSPDDFARILESIGTKLFTRDDETLVFPGHGLDTTVGTERPSLEAWRARGF